MGFPTETVYGVAARGDRREAVEALREAKGRAESRPFTVHISRPDEVDRFVPRLSSLARRMIRKGWPGPLTLVLPVDEPEQAPVIRETGPDGVSLMYHDGTVGIRCPSNPTASYLLAEAGVPVVAASANRSGQAPPRSADGAFAELSGRLDMLLDGGEARYAKPSTVVRLNGQAYDVLREGVIEARIVERLASLNILFVCSGNTCRSPMAAALCKRAIARRLGCDESELGKQHVSIQSAGTSAGPGLPASEPAVAVMAARGLDIRDHTSKHLDAESINHADYIFCMTQAHMDVVRALAPAAADRMSLLADEEIADPVGGTEETYHRCAERIEAAIERRLTEIEL